MHTQTFIEHLQKNAPAEYERYASRVMPKLQKRFTTLRHAYRGTDDEVYRAEIMSEARDIKEYLAMLHYYDK